VDILMQLSIASAPAGRQGFARCARRLTPPLTATVVPAQQVIKQSLLATASLINHWLKHEIPDRSTRGKYPEFCVVRVTLAQARAPQFL
jgi:hypothetical protein